MLVAVVNALVSPSTFVELVATEPEALRKGPSADTAATVDSSLRMMSVLLVRLPQGPSAAISAMAELFTVPGSPGLPPYASRAGVDDGDVEIKTLTSYHVAIARGVGLDTRRCGLKQRGRCGAVAGRARGKQIDGASGDGSAAAHRDAVDRSALYAFRCALRDEPGTAAGCEKQYQEQESRKGGTQAEWQIGMHVETSQM